jgi:nucleotide-binding universal stress UspA family protein
MYSRILVPLENSSTDVAILDHVRKLAGSCGAAVVLIHVADGWVARNIRQLDLRESEEMQKDRAYIEKVCAQLTGEGLACEALLASGDPAKEITDAASREQCDLIAMGTHGHKFINDLLRGSVADSVRHNTEIPVLLVRGGSPLPLDSGDAAGGTS